MPVMIVQGETRGKVADRRYDVRLSTLPAARHISMPSLEFACSNLLPPYRFAGRLSSNGKSLAAETSRYSLRSS